MTRGLTLLILAVAAAIPASSAAQERRFGPSEAYQRCMASGDAARGNVTAIDVCVGTEKVVQEQRLDDAFDRAMDRFGFWYQLELHNLQVEWRADSEARCVEKAGVDRRGNASGAIYSQCMLDETIARAAWLETYSPE